MIRACDVCGERRAVHWLSKYGRRLVRCPECGFVYMDRSPDEGASLHSLYEDPSYFSGGDYYLGYLAHERHHRLLARRILDAALTELDAKSWLDVGCAAGYLLDEARTRGLQVRGIDPSPAMVSHANALGLNVQLGTLATSKHAHESFDVVTFCDSLEHVDDPAGELRRAHEALTANGLIVIHTPDVESNLARWLGWRWPHFTPPEHVSYFTRSSLALLLARTGFVVVRATSLGHWFSFGECASKLIPPARRLFVGKPRSAFYLDVGDLFLIGRKRNARSAI